MVEEPEEEVGEEEGKEPAAGEEEPVEPGKEPAAEEEGPEVLGKEPAAGEEGPEIPFLLVYDLLIINNIII